MLTKVLLGDVVNLPPDNDLKHPPEKQDGSGLRYDTVQGKTNGSDVFIIYENGRAYPEYCVRYEHRDP